MGHINYALDWTVGAFIIYNERCLMIWHHKLNCWLCPGGHLEPGEDPEEGLHREVMEEVGLEIELVGEREPIHDERSKSLILPRFIDKHPITETHRHVGFFYLARPKSHTGKNFPIIGGEYAEGMWGWFDEAEVMMPKDESAGLDMWPATRYYAVTAIKELSHVDLPFGRS